MGDDIETGREKQEDTRTKRMDYKKRGDQQTARGPSDNIFKKYIVPGREVYGQENKQSRQ